MDTISVGDWVKAGVQVDYLMEELVGRVVCCYPSSNPRGGPQLDLDCGEWTHSLPVTNVLEKVDTNGDW